MRKRVLTRRSFLSLSGAAAAGLMLAGCTTERSDGKVGVEIVSYKQEAVSIFESIMAEFNETHDDIYLDIKSPADAVTIMKTRFVREDYPDVIGIGGDADYASFVDSEILADVSDYPAMDNVSEAYRNILKSVTYVPMDGIYGVPYVANAAGILYNVDMFEEKGWPIPQTWDEFIELCEEIKSEGEVAPMMLGYKDTWTILSPWNSIAINLVPSDLARQVNAGKAKFADYYREPAMMMRQMLNYCQSSPGPFALNYNGFCLPLKSPSDSLLRSAPYVLRNKLQMLPVGTGSVADGFSWQPPRLCLPHDTLLIAAPGTPAPASAGILIVTGNLYPRQLFGDGFRRPYPRQIILDGSNHAYCSRAWEKFCARHRLALLHTAEEGAIYLPIK